VVLGVDRIHSSSGGFVSCAPHLFLSRYA
jgi:hypothetical protein